MIFIVSSLFSTSETQKYAYVFKFYFRLYLKMKPAIWHQATDQYIKTLHLRRHQVIFYHMVWRR